MTQSDAQIDYAKPALTFEEQLRLLESRGMQVGAREAALRVLSQISYYRLSAYWHPFKQDDDSFRDGTTFEDALRLYNFDRRLRLCVLNGIERVEVVARTALTYVLSHAHGSFAHTIPTAFKADFDHQEWCAALDQEVQKSKDNVAFLSHYANKYKGFPRIPIWMATEVLMFGPLSRLCKKGLQSAQLEKMGSYLSLHPSLLPSWLHALSTARNICAHHGRLWNRHMGISPKLPKKIAAWNGVHGARVYATLLMIRYLTAPIDEGIWWKSATELIAETDHMMRTAMNVPEDWRTRPAP